MVVGAEEAVRRSRGGPPCCPLCGSATFGLRFPAAGSPGPVDARAVACTSAGHRRHPDIWRCDGCQLLVAWPQPAADDLLASYRDVEDPLYVAERANRYYTFERAARSLGPAAGRRLLDVGAYCGYFLDVARTAGFQAEGTELSRWAAAQARGLGLTVYEETLGERAVTGERYDVVTLWDVVEHFADPVDELRAARRLIADDGVLHLSTIDAGSLVARLFGRRWPWLMDMHLYYFDRDTVSRLLRCAGFEVQDIRHYTHVVSLGYLLAKLGAAYTGVARPARFLARHAPGDLRVPVQLGDNMHVVARPLH